MGEPRPRQRKFAPRSRQGCLTCRARRKRCDGQRPECQNCTRLNIKCEWQSQRHVVLEATATASPPAQHVTLPSTASLDPWDALPSERTAERDHLLRYYIQAFVPSISVATTSSSFYAHMYIPMAYKSEGMLDAILALSSAQLARRSVDANRAQYLRELSSKHETKCHSFIHEQISPDGVPSTDSYQVVGITLLLVGLEALNGNKTTRWLSRMHSARRILNALYQKQETMHSWELDSLQRHFTYHDVMATLMVGILKPERDPTEIDSSATYVPRNSLTIDPLMGISYYLCSLICRIHFVTASASAFPHLSKAAFDAIERDIQQWIYESPLSSPDIDLPVALDLIALAESYRLAALIQLYRTSNAHQHLIPSIASRAMQFVSRIPPGSPAESSLLYPIFLAGAELDKEEEISKCFQRLTAIQQRNRYDNVGMVREVLQEVWHPVLNCGKKRDWEEVLKEWGWSFSLG